MKAVGMKPGAESWGILGLQGGKSGKSSVKVLEREKKSMWMECRVDALTWLSK